MEAHVRKILDEKYHFFNHPRFIEHDPIQIPHLFTQKQDIEIMGFWVAILAWGQRKTILQNAHTLIDLMDGAPHEFILGHQEKAPSHPDPSSCCHAAGSVCWFASSRMD